jgi:hypothetical protein
MLASKKTRRGVIGAVVLAGVLAVSGYALTNVVTIADNATLAGLGVQAVQTLNVTDIDYTLDAADPTKVNSVVFTWDTGVMTVGNDARVFASFDDRATWQSCGTVADAALTATCTIAGSTQDNIDSLVMGNVHLVVAE